MLRSILPFILVSLGFTMILWTDRMPLFEWQVSETIADFPSVCDGNLPSYWTTKPGESLDMRERASLLENLNVVIRRSQNDEVVDRVASVLHSWLFWGSLSEVILSIIYMWWFLVWYKQGAVIHAVSFTAFAMGMCLLLSQVVRLAGPMSFGVPYYYFMGCHGTLTFSARLIKIYYETTAILSIGVLMELGTLGMMVRSVVRAIIQRKEFSKSAAG